MATSFIDGSTSARLRDSQPRALSYCHAHPENLSSWQNKVRRWFESAWEYRKMHSAPRLLDARIEISEEVDGYIRERLPPHGTGSGVPAFILRPLGQSGKVPAVLALHGHGPGKIIPAGLPPG